MSKLVRFGDILINHSDIAWVGIVQNFGPETILSFQFTNGSNNFTLKYQNRDDAVNALNSFEALVRNATVVLPLMTQPRTNT